MGNFVCTCTHTHKTCTHSHGYGLGMGFVMGFSRVSFLHGLVGTSWVWWVWWGHVGGDSTAMHKCGGACVKNESTRVHKSNIMGTSSANYVALVHGMGLRGWW
jgi:hypothetical protein